MKYREFEFGVCSIYVSNDHKERIELWKWIYQIEEIPWILGRDFDKKPQDKSGGDKIEWQGDERFFWNRMLSLLKLMDPLAGGKNDSKGI